MNLLQLVFSWKAVTYATPFIGIILCFFLLISNRVCTRRKAVSTAIALLLMLWLLLVWADWGSNNQPSYQIMWVRLIIMAIAGFVIYELRALRLRLLGCQAKNKRLEAQNRSLIKNLNDLNKQVNKQSNAIEDNHYV